MRLNMPMALLLMWFVDQKPLRAGWVAQKELALGQFADLRYVCARCLARMLAFHHGPVPAPRDIGKRV